MFNVISRFFYIIFIIFRFKLFLLFLNKKSMIFNFFKLNIQVINIGIERLGPIFIKLGQILSTRNDILDKELINEFEKLQNDVTFISFNIIKTTIEESLKMKIENIFIKINENPLSSASIAQIHAGVLLNGDKVIIKILKPGIKNIIKNDLAILKFFFNFLALLKKNLRLKLLDVILELENIFMRELDFKYEAAYISKFKQNFKSNPYFYAPNVYWEFTSDIILTLEYLDGINILNTDKFIREKIDVDDIINKLFEVFYLQFLKYNFFHADLHPGNILISKNNFSNSVIVFLDFGIVSFVTNHQKYYLIENILAFIKRDYKTIIQLHLNARTIITNKNIEDMECELRFIFDPILNKNLNSISIQKFFTALLSFSKEINLQMQPKLLLFQKTLLSVESIARRLNPNINLWIINNQLIEKNFVIDVILNKIISKLKGNRTNLNYINDEIVKHNVFFYIINFLFSTYFFYYLFIYCYILLIFLIVIEYYNCIIFLV